ncbi:flagellar biosynthetic protein FliO [Oxalobacteraceae bacterium]|nr:flagellar biosynthetic protein FliO [Oxalobacteraceae bacterium]
MAGAPVSAQHSAASAGATPTTPAAAVAAASSPVSATPAASPAAAAAATPAVAAAGQAATVDPAVVPSAVLPGAGAPVQLGVAPTAAPAPPSAASSAGSLLQTTFALGFVLALLIGLAWLMKRYGPRISGAGGNVRMVGSLSVGARERILVVEVGDQWIVVGASPGRMNALATMPRQHSSTDADATLSGAALPGSNFAEWFKQTIEKRNGK